MTTQQRPNLAAGIVAVILVLVVVLTAMVVMQQCRGIY